jgi:hypothetical protein
MLRRKLLRYVWIITIRSIYFIVVFCIVLSIVTMEAFSIQISWSEFGFVKLFFSIPCCPSKSGSIRRLFWHKFLIQKDDFSLVGGNFCSTIQSKSRKKIRLKIISIILNKAARKSFQFVQTVARPNHLDLVAAISKVAVILDFSREFQETT